MIAQRWLSGLVIAAVASGAGPAAAQGYEPPRTPSGRPDLQGIWTNSSVTDLERPEGVDALVLTAAEAARFREADALVDRVRSDAAPTDPDAPLLDGSDLRAGRGYNAFWIDPGLEVGRVKGEHRSSWIVDPEDGRIPYSPEGRAHVARARALVDENYDGPEIRPLGERCLATTGRVGPPMVNGLYNNHYQIVQTPDHVVILSEMVQHARIVPIGGGHRPDAFRPLFGDAIGWWEGDTLVVESTSFSPLHALWAHPVYLTETATVTERFTRWADDQLFYEYTVEDPALYSQPWRGESTLWADEGRIFEYACHESNYSMSGILGGAREEERRASQAR